MESWTTARLTSPRDQAVAGEELHFPLISGSSAPVVISLSWQQAGVIQHPNRGQGHHGHALLTKPTRQKRLLLRNDKVSAPFLWPPTRPATLLANNSSD